MIAPVIAPADEERRTPHSVRVPSPAFQAAKGTTISDGKGINELSIVIRRYMVK
jgi:hypothetical protein